MRVCVRLALRRRFFGGLITARRVDARRCFVLSGSAVGADRSTSPRVLAGPAVGARRRACRGLERAREAGGAHFRGLETEDLDFSHVHMLIVKLLQSHISSTQNTRKIRFSTIATK